MPIIEHFDMKIIKRALDEPSRLPDRSWIEESFFPRDRWPSMVRYDERGVIYVPRDHFALEPRTSRPSDCVWIVPGTTP